MRPDGREPQQIRPLTIETGFIRYPEGSVLYRAGDTMVLCNVSVSDRTAPFLRGSGEGWILPENVPAHIDIDITDLEADRHGGADDKHVSAAVRTVHGTVRRLGALGFKKSESDDH